MGKWFHIHLDNSTGVPPILVQLNYIHLKAIQQYACDYFGTPIGSTKYRTATSLIFHSRSPHVPVHVNK